MKLIKLIKINYFYKRALIQIIVLQIVLQYIFILRNLCNHKGTLGTLIKVFEKRNPPI